jgi:opacity protein-like surface antigen
MRALIAVVLAAACGVAVGFIPRSAAAQDVEALRKELEHLRQQQQEYQRAVEALSERLRRLEAQPLSVPVPPTAAEPAPVPPAVAQPTPVPPPVAQAPSNPATPTSPLPPSDVLRPRQPFSLYQQRGAGQLLFDMGVTGDFVGNLTQHNVQKANAGTFAGRENRFFPREVELNLFGQIDPFARADIRIEAGEDTPGSETSVSLAEATITLLTMPYGTQAKLGQMRNRFGWSNVVHEHDLPWVDRPDVYRVFLGEDGFKEKGVEATWVPDFLPFYVEVLGGVFNGDNETAFGRGILTHPLVTGRVRAFFDLTDTSAVQVGASLANGETADRLRSRLLGYDLKYKYRPEGWLFPLLTLGSEGIYSMRRVEVGDATAGDVIDTRTRDRFGWYGWAELQPLRRWSFGTRYDWTQYPENPGQQWAIEPYVSFFPSEFLRFRLGYKHTDRDHRDGFDLNGGSGRRVDEVFLQGTLILGAHPAHPF